MKYLSAVFVISILIISIIYINSNNATNQLKPNLKNTVLSYENNTLKTSFGNKADLVKPAINFKDNKSKCMTRGQRSISVSDSLKSMGMPISNIEVVMKDYVATTNLIEDKSFNMINVGMMTYGRLIRSIETNLRHQGTVDKNIYKTIKFTKTRLSSHIGIKLRPDINNICIGTINDILFVSYVKSYTISRSK